MEFKMEKKYRFGFWYIFIANLTWLTVIYFIICESFNVTHLGNALIIYSSIVINILISGLFIKLEKIIDLLEKLNGGKEDIS